MWKKSLCSAILVAAFLCTLTQGVWGADSGLDVSFGTDGRLDVTLGGYGDRARAVLVLPDGRILVAGSSSSADGMDFSLFRFMPDGTADSSFNYDGSVVTPVGSGDDEILALGLLADGRIIAAGYTSNGEDRDFALACYHPDGTLDRDFGDDGLVVTQVGNGDDEITALVIDSRDRILVTGAAAGTAGRVVVLARFLDTGILDSSFAVQGMNLSGIGTDAVAQGIALQDDGRILVSGSFSDGSRTGVMVAGFSPDGELDTSFGVNGIGVTAEFPYSEGYGLLLRDDGSILVAGSVGAEGERDAALFGFTADGLPDADLGRNGVLVSPAGPDDDVLFAIAEEGNTLSASGYTTEAGRHRFLLVTYVQQQAPSVLPEAPSEPVAAPESSATGTTLHIGELKVAGSLASSSLLQDEEIPVSRLVPRLTTTEFSADDAVSYALAIQPDGKVVAVGADGDPDGTDSVAMARYVEPLETGSGTTAASFNGTIITHSVSQVTRTGAVVTSEIITAETIVERGVVFSTIPYPDLDSVSPDNPDTPSDGSLSVSITSPVDGATFDAGTTETTLSATTSVDATCEYSMTSDTGATIAPQAAFSATGAQTHTTTLTGLSEGGSYTVTVSCIATDTGDQASATVRFSVETATKLLDITARTIGGLFVSDAYAVTTVTETATTTEQSDTTATPDLFTAMDDSFVTSGSTSDGGGSGIFSSVLANLRPGTFFYVRAYAKTESGEVYYGNQQGFRTADSCFIATAAFGSILHPYVRTLRDFRDQFLLGNGPGKMFVTLYYRYSPTVADHIAAVPALRAVTRILLLPVVGAAWIALQAGLAGLLLVVIAMAAVWWYLVSSRTLPGREPNT